jgi:hypothetical protein
VNEDGYFKCISKIGKAKNDSRDGLMSFSANRITAYLRRMFDIQTADQVDRKIRGVDQISNICN